MIETILGLSIAACALCWGLAGLAFAWERWTKAQFLVDDEGGPGNGGRDPGDDDPRDPFQIDPTDPGDWWKHNAERDPR